MRELLGKLVAVAKRGELCEQELAIKRVQRLCEELHLNFDEVMSDRKIEEFVFPYRRGQRNIVAQIIERYAKLNNDDPVWINRYRKVLICKTTKENYVETVNAMAVLLPAYKQEIKNQRKTIETAFVVKHDLYYMKRDDEEEKEEAKPLTPEQEQRLWAARQMAGNMKDVDIRKAIESPK